MSLCPVNGQRPRAYARRYAVTGPVNWQYASRYSAHSVLFILFLLFSGAARKDIELGGAQIIRKRKKGQRQQLFLLSFVRPVHLREERNMNRYLLDGPGQKKDRKLLLREHARSASFLSDPGLRSLTTWWCACAQSGNTEKKCSRIRSAPLH